MMKVDSKDYQEAKVITETLLAFVIYLRFGGDTAWKDSVSVDQAFITAKSFTSRMEQEMKAIKAPAKA
jgi:hypothetical protein